MPEVIGTRGSVCWGTYDHENAELTLRVIGRNPVKLDEDACDRLLRVYEYANDPAEDLVEFFEDEPEFNHRAAVQAAQWFAQNAAPLALCVYMTT